ncbi:MAG: DUF1992 domain-containing protein [Planctomycetota bacterium]
MSGRKPAGESWESWVERRIREAQERGEFDDLRGAGKPIPGLERPYDPLWWTKELLRRERLSLVPETLALGAEVERGLLRIWRQRSAAAVRRLVQGLNARILEVNAGATGGPPSRVMLLDPEEVVRAWRERREAEGGGWRAPAAEG